MIGAFLLLAAPVVFAAPAGQRPAFNVPRHLVCVGSNRSNQLVNIDVVIEGDEHSTTFLLTPLKASAWPRAPLKVEGQRADFFRSDKNALWYWVGTNLKLDQGEYGFGFDINVSGGGHDAIRFSRSQYDPTIDSTEVKFDPQGAYLDDVPCHPAGAERG
jgi:hypothetical protein